MPLDAPERLTLAHGFAFADLYDAAGLARLDARFVLHLEVADASLAARLAEARRAPDALQARPLADFLIALAPHVEDFVAELFGIVAEVRALEEAHHALAPLYAVKRAFVQRRALHAYGPDVAATFDGMALHEALAALMDEPWSELAFARAVERWLAGGETCVASLDLAARYAAWAVQTPAGRAAHKGGVLFRMPHKLDPMHLVPIEAVAVGGVRAWRAPDDHRRWRDGFALTDAGTDLAGGLDQAHYCIWCHEQGKDSCARGLVEKRPADQAAATDPFRRSPFGVTLAGCPLEERISEFHKLRAEGWPLAALAMICLDNPMVAGTGHRICNDCMKSCIYQKQDPVDIPQSETRVLKDVLALPWGFEIYGLLTRWNPLDLRRPVPRTPSGRRVLVVGMGPAGCTLAHHLVNDGHTVVGIDGLKIEPLDPALCGVGIDGTRVPFAPVRDVEALREPLDARVMAGFGGVAEYGITVRWDKNFLKLLRLLLERRERFAMHGGVRFGGTLDVEGAFALGFDHVTLAAGAGRPTVLDLPNGLAHGVRTASDFLMALQLGGAARRDTLANVQVRLPVVVIGGGLTAIDTATEALAYYPVQVERFLARYETLVAEQGTGAVEAAWSAAERNVAAEFLAHARALREERTVADREHRAPRLAALLETWGGSTIAYRRRLVDAPAYTLNHEEVAKALEEGVRFAENLTPLAIEVDAHGHACGLAVAVGGEGRALETAEGEGPSARAVLPARTILIAAGTQPNTVLAREDPAHFTLDGRYFRLLDEEGRPVTPVPGLAKPPRPAVLTSMRDDGRAVTFFGDLHPSYHGNVVKAMASAKAGAPIVSRSLMRHAPASPAADAVFLAAIAGRLAARVVRVERLTPTIVEVVVHAPAAAQRFCPGQFYRLQNFEALAPQACGTRLALEGIALTGAWVDRARGLVSTIVLEMGGSSSLCRVLAPGDPVVLMGPTGTPTQIACDETVVLAGGGLGNAVLFSIGQALRAAGSRVLYFAGYKKIEDRYRVDDIENAADVVVWCCDEAPGFVARRAQDRAFTGNVVQAMLAHAQGALGPCPIAIADADRIIAIGSERMMAAVAGARHGVLAPHLKRGHHAIGSINSPMQCMMKEVCGQCLQPQRDPVTGATRIVFSCFAQDQPLDAVDFGALSVRLAQNGTQEKLTAAWIARCLRRFDRERRASVPGAPAT